MKNRLIIVGAGGHGKVVLDNALKNGYTDINFIDDNEEGSCMGFPIIGDFSLLNTYGNDKADFVIAVGDNIIRKKIAEQYNLNWIILIHPSAQIGLNIQIGLGTVVMAGAIINSCANIGKHCIINTGATIEHDDVIADYVHISPQAVLGGTVNIERGCHIGIGSIIKNNIRICNECIVGAGAVVVKDLTEPGKYIGIPARKI